MRERSRAGGGCGGPHGRSAAQALRALTDNPNAQAVGLADWTMAPENEHGTEQAERAGRRPGQPSALRNARRH